MEAGSAENGIDVLVECLVLFSAVMPTLLFLARSTEFWRV
jgi:hypothetical protein